MKKSIVLSLFTLFALTGCQKGTSLNSLSFSQRKKRATLIDEKSDKKETTNLISREEIKDFDRFSIKGNVRYKPNVRTGKSYTYTIRLISPSVLITESARTINSSQFQGDFSFSSCFASFGSGRFIIVDEGQSFLDVYSSVTGEKLSTIGLGQYQLESSSRNNYGVDFFRLSNTNNHNDHYFASYVDSNGNEQTESLTEEQYNSRTIKGDAKKDSKYKRLYELGLNSENYYRKSKSRIFDQNLSRIADRNSLRFASSASSTWIPGNGKRFRFGYEKYTSMSDIREHYHAFAYELDLNSGNVSYKDHLNFLVKEVYPVYETKNFNGEDYRVMVGSYICYYPLDKEGIIAEQMDRMAYLSDNLSLKKSTVRDPMISYEKQFVNPNTLYLSLNDSSNYSCFIRRENNIRTYLDQVSYIKDLDTQTVVYKDKKDKFHECDHTSIVNDPSQGFDLISDYKFNGVRIKATMEKGIQYRLNDGNIVPFDYSSYLNQGRVITDNAIYPFNQSRYSYSFNGASVNNVSRQEYSDVYNLGSHTKTTTYLYQVSLSSRETKGYLVTWEYYCDKD